MSGQNFLIKNGINKIIVRTDRIRGDLSLILRNYQDQGIEIYECDGGYIKFTTIPKKPWFEAFFFRIQTIIGLRKHTAGGFGGIIPDETSGGLG